VGVTALVTPIRESEEVHQVLDQIGLPYWRRQINRRITAMRLAEEPDIGIRIMRSILGHESEAMTDYYARHQPVSGPGDEALRQRAR
jgi:hypothetical protein